MPGGIDASVTLHVEVLDPQAMWDHALGVYAATQLRHKIYDPDQPTRLADELHGEFTTTMCGTRDDPDIGECLRMIFDPGESPPGLLIDDSSAELARPAWDANYPHFIGDRGDLGTDGLGGGHDQDPPAIDTGPRRRPASL